MLAKTTTYTIFGIGARPVFAEVDIRSGLPAFSIVGLPDTAVREARERVRAAMLNEGFEFPQRRITVNVGPAEGTIRTGPSLDLPIALALLAASGQVDIPSDKTIASVGELSLDGALHPIRGVLAVAQASAAHSDDLLLVPQANLREAQLGSDRVRPIRRLSDVVDALNDPTPETDAPELPTPPGLLQGPDLKDLRGHEIAIRALTIAAAGGHSVLFEGPPGCGKTMIARRLPSILPPMTHDEALDVTKIQSIAGSLRIDGLAKQRPFRAPHHSISASGLTGGGASPMPGEISLSHHGVLFLDELAEFSTRTLESLTQPLEDGSISVTRENRTVIYPARAQLVAATNPCPCGHGGNNCRCSQQAINRYQSRLAGPLINRFDMRVLIQRPTPAEVEAGPVTDSATTRELVTRARKLQTERFDGTEFTTNASLDGSATRRLLKPPDDVREPLNDAYRANRLSLRGYDRTLRIARTIADLDGRHELIVADVAEALTFHAPTQEMALAA